ncbi:MAG: hypothetical protein RLZZ297_1981 [Chloroflexota bacterium]|jgi:selenocysteine lyase/cysteine desulfurase
MQHPITDPLGLRAEFPITERFNYLNCAAIAPLSHAARNAGIAFLDERMYEPWPDPAPMGLIRLRQRKDRVRAAFARLIGADAGEIGLTESTSAGENIVVRALDLKPGDEIIVDALHFESSFLLYRQLERSHGIVLRIVAHKNGMVDPEDIAAACGPRTRMVSVSWVSNRNGFRHDVAQIAAIAHSHGAFCYVDAIQAVGTFVMDVHAADIDFLACGSYKWLYANFGVSFLYVKNALLDRIPSDRFGHTHVASATDDLQFTVKTDASKYEYAAIAHTSVAQLEGALSLFERVGIAAIEQHGLALANRLWQGLEAAGCDMFTPPHTQSAIVSIMTHEKTAALDAALKANNIAYLMRENNTSLRLGCAMFNTAAEIDQCVDVIRGVMRA